MRQTGSMPEGSLGLVEIERLGTMDGLPGVERLERSQTCSTGVEFVGSGLEHPAQERWHPSPRFVVDARPGDIQGVVDVALGGGTQRATVVAVDGSTTGRAVTLAANLAGDDRAEGRAGEARHEGVSCHRTHRLPDQLTGVVVQPQHQRERVTMSSHAVSSNRPRDTCEATSALLSMSICPTTKPSGRMF